MLSKDEQTILDNLTDGPQWTARQARLLGQLIETVATRIANERMVEIQNGLHDSLLRQQSIEGMTARDRDAHIADIARRERLR